jgi:hypothetical protein
VPESARRRVAAAENETMVGDVQCICCEYATTFKIVMESRRR